VLFYLSKIFWYFAQPSALLLILLVGAAALLRTRYRKTAERLVILSAAMFVLGGLLPLGVWLILPLEERFSRPDLSGQDVQGIVVLGGVESARVSAGRNVHAVNEAAERLTETAALARRFPDAKIVFTGASIGLFTATSTGADAAKLILRDFGIEDSNRLLIEKKARSTWENALYTKELVQPKPDERWLLVTSAWHMPRAIGAFRKAGFDVEAWPVDYRTAGWSDALVPFDAPSEGLRRLDLVTREWIGLVAYWMLGRSSALLPAPD
jgi:uncharacterized SAM-binding protein YcdF (DUF218 family)